MFGWVLLRLPSLVLPASSLTALVLPQRRGPRAAPAFTECSPFPLRQLWGLWASPHGNMNMRPRTALFRVPANIESV